MNGVELVASWLTPAVLFCVLNLMIGAVFVISGFKPRGINPPKATENDAAVSPPQLVRSPSLFERVNSIKLSFSRATVPASTVHHEDAPNRDEAGRQISPEVHVTRSKSDTGAKASSSSAPMKKSASEKVPAAYQKEQEGDEAVDARADDFINRFRQHLKMQRLDSLLKRSGGSTI